MKSRNWALLAGILAAASLAMPATAQLLINGPLVLIIGPPSSGKSTQAATLAESLGVPIISVERMIADNPAAFGSVGQPRMGGMEPESDPVLNRLFQQRLEAGDLSRGAILDGYPSTKDHADFLSKLASDGKMADPVIIQLDIPDDEVMRRSANQPGRTPDAVAQRLKDYHREMDFVRLYFPNADINTVDGTMSPEAVGKAIKAILDNHNIH